jgi:hypothetical protein
MEDSFGRVTGVFRRQRTPPQDDKQLLVVLSAAKDPLYETLEVFSAGLRTLVDASKGFAMSASLLRFAQNDTVEFVVLNA